MEAEGGGASAARRKARLVEAAVTECNRAWLPLVGLGRCAWRAVATAMTLALLVSLVGCERGTDDDTSSRPSVSATPTAAVREEAVAAYEAWMKVSVELAATSDYQSPKLREYLVDPELTERTTGLKSLRDSGLVVVGQPTWTARVTSLRLDAQPPAAVLQVCLDTSGWTIVHTSDKSNAEASGQAERFYATITEQKLKGRWFIAKNESHRDQPC